MRKNKVIEAIQSGTPLNKLNDIDTTKVVNSCTSMIIENSGQPCDTMNLYRFVDFLKEDYYFLTDLDLIQICQYGSIGEFGEYYGINQRSFLKWTKEYIKVRYSYQKDMKRFEDNGAGTNQRLIEFSNLIKIGIREKKFSPDGELAIRRLYAGIDLN